MDFDKAFIGLSLLLLVFIIGVNLVAEGTVNYGLQTDNSSLIRVSNQSIALSEKQQELTSKLTSGDIEQNNAVENMIYGASLAIRSMATSVGSFGSIGASIMLELGSLAGYPILALTIINILAFALISGLIYLILRISK